MGLRYSLPAYKDEKGCIHILNGKKLLPNVEQIQFDCGEALCDKLIKSCPRGEEIVITNCTPGKEAWYFLSTRY